MHRVVGNEIQILIFAVYVPHTHTTFYRRRRIWSLDMWISLAALQGGTMLSGFNSIAKELRTAKHHSGRDIHITPTVKERDEGTY